MKNTLFIYILMGCLFILPLIAFNIRKIWVKKPPEPVKFKPVRCIVITVITAFIAVFLVSAYNQTLKNRYEIAAERLATQHGAVLKGKASWEDFRAFVAAHGTDKAMASFDAVTPAAQTGATTVKFQISSQYLPKYWQGVEGFDQAEAISDENPIYLMYLLDADGQRFYYTYRMVWTGEEWKYDWFGEATDAHKKVLKMPSEINGKWYTVD